MILKCISFQKEHSGNISVFLRRHCVMSIKRYFRSFRWCPLSAVGRTTALMSIEVQRIGRNVLCLRCLREHRFSIHFPIERHMPGADDVVLHLTYFSSIAQMFASFYSALVMIMLCPHSDCVWLRPCSSFCKAG